MKSSIYKLGLAVLITACVPKDGDVVLPSQPIAASFTAVPTTENANKIILTNTTSNTPLAKWVFSGGPSVPSAEPVTAYFPLKGDYKINMTAIGKGGVSTPVEKMLNVPKSDPTNNEIKKLTGGIDGQSRTWVWNHAAGAFGVGPSKDNKFDPTDPEDQQWYTAGQDNFSGSCIYDDSYVFTLNDAQTYLNVHNGNYQWGWAWANYILGKSQGQYADDCFISKEPASTSWSLEYRKGSDGKSYPYLILTKGSNMGYYEGRSEYQILSITDTAMTLRAPFGDPDANGNPGSNGWRYFKYLKK
jgi:hypothetical protein